MNNSAWKSNALFVAPADEVIRSDTLSADEIVFVFGRFSLNVELIVISCADVKRFVVHLYMFQAQAAPAPAAAVRTAEFTGRRYESSLMLRSHTPCGFEASAIISPGIDILCT